MSWPRLSEANPLLTPTVEPTASTAGSASSTSTTRFCRASMAEKETEGSASVLPSSCPVSWVGRKPLGTSRYSRMVPTKQPSVTSSIVLRQRRAMARVRA